MKVMVLAWPICSMGTCRRVCNGYDGMFETVSDLTMVLTLMQSLDSKKTQFTASISGMGCSARRHLFTDNYVPFGESKSLAPVTYLGSTSFGCLSTQGRNLRPVS
jgi:hypothetical protein